MTSDGRTRRRFLGRTLAIASAVGLSGCLDSGSDDGTTGETETGGSDGEGTDATDGTEPTGTSDGESTATSPRDVSFEAPHGATIEATAYGNGDCGVVLVPQINLDRGSWRPQAEWIAESGHLALAIDEDPDDRPSSVRGAIRHLRERAGVTPLVLVGASSGGEAVVVANAETDATVDGTITLSAGGGADRASDLQGRTLFVVSTGDEDRFVRVARELHDGAPEPTELVEYEGAAHGQGIFETEHRGDLRDEIGALLSAVCGG